MKIERLKIRGFGSYANEQVLDFQEALKFNNMFVISGKTGAGKTMIFDAIHYALYGQASGADRQEKTLKSDFIPQGICPFVELSFSLKGEQYTVYRSLAYDKKKARGEGFTHEEAKTNLRKSGELLFSKTIEVNKELELILGFNAQQFKQLVMIPQGEFKKLLLAKSDERTKIFQKIFGTYLYEALQTRSKEEAAERHQAVIAIQNERLLRIQAFSLLKENEEQQSQLMSNQPNLFRIGEIFQEELAKEDACLKELEIQQKNMQTMLARLNQRLSQATAGVALTVKRENYQRELANLDTQRSLEKEKLERLEEAKRAKAVYPFYERVVETTKRKEQAEQQLRDEREMYQQIDAKFQQVYIACQQTKEDLKEKAGLQKQREELLRIKEIVSQYEDAKNKRMILQKEIAKQNLQIQALAQQMESDEQEIESIAECLLEIAGMKEKRSQLSVEVLTDQQQLDQLDSCLEQIESYLNLNREYKQEQKKFVGIEEKRTQKKTAYESLQLQYDRNLAGLMAKGLRDGEACLVCGSRMHPQPAPYEGELIEKAEIEVAKHSYELEQDAYLTYVNQLEKLKTELDLRLSEVTRASEELQLKGQPEELQGIVIEMMDEMRGRLNQHLVAQKDLEQEIKKEVQYTEQKTKLTAEWAGNQKKLESKRQDCSALQGQEKNLDEACDRFQELLDGQVYTLAELHQQVDALMRQMQILDENYNQARNQFTELNGQLEKQKGMVQSLELQHAQLVDEAEKWRIQYEEAMRRESFQDESQFLSCHCDDKTMDTLLRWITDYQNQRIQIHTALKELQEQLEGMEVESVSELQEEISIRETELQELQKKESHLFHINKNNLIIQEDFTRLTKQIEKEEAAYSEIATLAKILNGDNQQKLSFERYVLGAYFEQIIQAANLRLEKMTQHRYTLVRKTEVGDKRRAGGLDLQIKDAYTGKLRDVSTLSGGESFKAALSMALGLADVVQSFAGGIQMDTIFIDEGFGSLDSESLDTAIDCLADLQDEGRIVGVISHVEELKNRIPVRLEVIQRSDGSHAKFTKNIPCLQ